LVPIIVTMYMYSFNYIPTLIFRMHFRIKWIKHTGLRKLICPRIGQINVFQKTLRFGHFYA